MKEPHRKGIAIHPDPESCAGNRKGAGEALTGAHAGWVLSSEILFSGADAVLRSGRPQRGQRQRKRAADPAESKAPGMCGNSRCENRETPGTPVARKGRAGWRRP